MPASVPRPIAISASAIASPVRTGAWAARRSRPAMGLPWENSWSWVPM